MATAVAAAFLAAVLLPSWGDRSSVRIVSPRHLATALGPTPIELELAPASGLSVERVELFVDQDPLVTLTAPPWKTVWDAGARGGNHRLKAVAHFSDGSRAVSLVRTTPLVINEVEEVDLVNLYVVVRGEDGNYISGLTAGDFALWEDGRPEPIERFSTERKPLQIGIVLDSSLTMAGGKLEAAQKAALDFLDVLEPGDLGMVVAFNEAVHVLQPPTGERRLLASAIRAAEAGGGTALYDAVWRTAEQLSKLDGRRVMVLLSDGRDEAAHGLEPGSLHTLDEALMQALRREVLVFAIGLGEGLDGTDFYMKTTLREILRRMAETTGGRVLLPSRVSQLKKAFHSIKEDLRHQYSIAYVSANELRDGAWRELRLTVPGQPAQVITRSGYFAPSN